MLRLKGDRLLMQPTTHIEQLISLKKIEGQIRGIQRMIDEKKYCVDIITQISSIIGALRRVENDIFKKHIEGCVANALKGRSAGEKKEKISEVVDLVFRLR
jgi:CsoR family transcriptional regulator, copper-sensing transcriptional repressor